MAKKPKQPKPDFPKPREEFAGEIAPSPTSHNHNLRFSKTLSLEKDSK